MSRSRKDFFAKKNKWTYQYRMVVLNDDTFEERFSLKLNRLNVLLLGAIVAVLLIAITTVVIAFTPIRQYIPGYSNAKVKKTAIALTMRTDSLSRVLRAKDEQYNRMKRVLLGDLSFDDLQHQKDSIAQANNNQDLSVASTNKADSLLREEVAQADRFNILSQGAQEANFVLFTPVNGQLTAGFDPATKHYAVDLAANTGTPIKAAADGTVIFAGWTTDTGYTLILEHEENLITVYKHAGQLLKEQNDRIQTGEVIATVGNTGELTTGPHLHFELWHKGYPLDPTNFISFK